jgi:nitrite reductase (NO-forming)
MHERVLSIQLRLRIIFLILILQIIALLVLNNNGSQVLAFSSQEMKSNPLPSVTVRSSQQIIHNDHLIIKKFTLIADDRNIVKISPDNILHPGGILYKAMTYNGTIPGPAIVVNQGDIFQITVYNKGDLVHSLDLHGIEGPSHALISVIKPGENSTLKAKAEYPGVFMYHCDGDNLNGIWDHIASGMYGGIIVHPKNERPIAKEFYMVFGEIYSTGIDSGLFTNTSNMSATVAASVKKEIGSFDMNKFLANKPDLILTNGMAYKYMPFFGTISKILLNKNAEVFKVKPGELTRWYIVNAGPRGYLSFNFASNMIRTIHYNTNTNTDTDPNNFTDNNSTTSSIISNAHPFSSISKVYEVTIPPGSAEEIEAIFPEQGSYVGNDHDIGRFLQGAGFVVLATDNSTSYDHPQGTWISR